MKTMNWMAIGLGVAVCVAAWIVVMLISTLMPMTAAGTAAGQLWLNRSIGMGSRFAGGYVGATPHFRAGHAKGE